MGAKLSLAWEIVKGGFVELWAHKLRSTLTLTLLMLGVFALVVMSSVLDGVMDKIGTGFAGMSWDGTVMLDPEVARDDGGAEAVRDEPGLARGRPAAPRGAGPEGLRLPAARDQAVGRQGRRRHGADVRSTACGPTTRRWMNRPIVDGPRPDRERRAPALDGRRRRRHARIQALRRRGPGRPRHHGRGRAVPGRRRPGAEPDLHRGALVRRQRDLDPAARRTWTASTRPTRSRTSRSSSRRRRTWPRSPR